MSGAIHLHRPVRAHEGLAAWSRRALVALLALTALGEIAGGGALAFRPDGSLLSMPLSLLSGSFPDYLVPGSLLLGLGALAAFAALAVARGWRSDWLLAGASGVGLMAWIAVQLSLVGYVHWMQPLCGAVGLALGLLALPLVPRRS